MPLKIEHFCKGLFLKLLLFSLLIAACGGIVSAPNEKLKVESTFPADGAEDVDKGIAAISITFNKEMDPATVNQSSFLLKDVKNETPIEGTVSTSGKSVIFKPTSLLKGLETYTATLTSGARDLTGDSIVADFSWSFTLSDAFDDTPFVVLKTNPANNAVNVPVNISDISVTFSKAVDPGTVIANTTLSLNHGTLVEVSPSPDSKTFTLKLADPTQLDFKRRYDLEVKGGPDGIKDTSGRELDLSNNPNPDPANKPDTYISVFETKAETGDF